MAVLSADLLLGVCVAYVVLLFAIAFYVDRQSRRGRADWLRSPVVFTLSISVYCTSWTFYGAVGSAARNGLEFITIYLGPTLVFVGWWWLLRKLVRIGREHRVTSIADLISSRYGKSASLGVLVTLIALIATTPYIALQLQSLTRSYQIIVGDVDVNATAFYIAAGLALFAVLFGTRHLDANERHHGVVAAIAVEAVVKLVALLAVGTFVVFSVAGGVGPIFRDIDFANIHGSGTLFDSRWVTLTLLSAMAIICLPRQFQVTVVENVDERHLATASWLFPLYLFGMCLFVLPIAVVGLKFLPADANPDLYVLTLPLSMDRQDLALLAFLGGFSSATSMVIVAAIAISTMISNHIVMPIALQFLAPERGVSGDVRQLLLTSRRICIAAVLGLGFLYFRLSGGSDALAAIGLISFAGVAQFMPGLLGGIFWRGATRTGALSGLVVGFGLWAYTLFLPSFSGEFMLSASTLIDGPFGIAALRPQSLLGLDGFDPLVHALIWSLGANSLVFLVVSGFTEPQPLERLQGALFIDVFSRTPQNPARYAAGQATFEELFVLAQRILGNRPARRLFDEMADEHGLVGKRLLPSDAVITRLEREFAGSIGAASAHAVIGRVTGQQSVSMTDLMDIADETQRLMETYRQLSEKSGELTQALAQLKRANEKLRNLDAQKDEFMSQVSHELRTPMTSIRSVSEILLSEEPISEEEHRRFLTIIHEESLRLTRLLNEILDVSRLEAGSLHVPVTEVDVQSLIDATLESLSGTARQQGVQLEQNASTQIKPVRANEDRLRQVLINLVSNAMNYNTAADPSITVRTIGSGNDQVHIDVIDNGGGVSRADADLVFEKFRRGREGHNVQGVGLGLPISRALMRGMGGDLTLEFNDNDSSYFRMSLPVAHPAPAAS